MAIIQSLPALVARIPANLHAKLLTSFLLMVGLLIVMGVISSQVVSQDNRRVEEFVLLQNKLAAYRQLQYDSTEQLYNITSALLVPDDQTVDAALRQMRQFGYDFERLQFVAQNEAELLSQVQADYSEFTRLATEVTSLIHAGNVDQARALESAQARPLADRLQRGTNQLVNKAEAQMLTRIETSHEAFVASQWIVIASAAASIVLALLLGYTISWSVTGPVKQMDARLKAIANGDFSQHVTVANRDELGTLAANLNRMNDEIAVQSDQLAEWNHTLERRVQQQVEEIQHARERLVTAREEERRRLRRDLHDGLGPALASLFQRLDTALALVRTEPDTAAALLADLKGQVRAVIADIRRLVYALRPPTLDEFGLLGAIREHALHLTGVNHLRLMVHGPDALPALPAAVEVAAYRIALEGLTNVIRHAQANECNLSLSLSDALYLEIDDDGEGIPLGSRAGVGIASMRERALELGGELKIEAGSVRGTRLWARLPLSQVQA